MHKSKTEWNKPVAQLSSTLSGVLSDDEQCRSGVYFFLSLDLVNSTQYKTDLQDKWPFMIRSFYDKAVKEVAASFGTFHSPHTKSSVFEGVLPSLWKYIGDEVLFFLRLRTEKQAASCVEAAYAALEATRLAMENATSKATQSS